MSCVKSDFESLVSKSELQRIENRFQGDENACQLIALTIATTVCEGVVKSTMKNARMEKSRRDAMKCLLRGYNIDVSGMNDRQMCAAWQKVIGPTVQEIHTYRPRHNNG